MLISGSLYSIVHGINAYIRFFVLDCPWSEMLISGSLYSIGHGVQYQMHVYYCLHLSSLLFCPFLYIF